MQNKNSDIENSESFGWTVAVVSAADTYPLRQRVLRSGQPISACRFEGDDSEDTIHMGLYGNAKIIGIVSLYPRNMQGEKSLEEYQLRGMATDRDFQGQGFGSALLGAAIWEVWDRGGLKIWCRARIKALSFYTRHGFEAVGESFDVPGIGLHRLAVLTASSA